MRTTPRQFMCRAIAPMAALLLVTGCPLGGEDQSGDINGRVTREGGGAIEGANVSLREVTGESAVDATTEVATAITSADGSFRFDDVDEGSYRVIVEADGYPSYVRTTSPNGSVWFKLREAALDQVFQMPATGSVELTVPTSAAANAADWATLTIEAGDLEYTGESSTTISNAGDIVPVGTEIRVQCWAWEPSTVGNNRELFPADLFAANADRGVEPLRTAGMLDCEFEDGNGDDVNVADGETMGLRVCLQNVDDAYLDQIESIADDFKLYDLPYDGSGLWERIANVTYDTECMSGELPHWSPKNFDARCRRGQTQSVDDWQCRSDSDCCGTDICRTAVRIVGAGESRFGLEEGDEDPGLWCQTSPGPECKTSNDADPSCAADEQCCSNACSNEGSCCLAGKDSEGNCCASDETELFGQCCETRDLNICGNETCCGGCVTVNGQQTCANPNPEWPVCDEVDSNGNCCASDESLVDGQCCADSSINQCGTQACCGECLEIDGALGCAE